MTHATAIAELPATAVIRLTAEAQDAHGADTATMQPVATSPAHAVDTAAKTTPRPVNAAADSPRLRVHVLHLATGWFADIDDEDDRQFDDPYWCQDRCSTLHEAVSLGCKQLAQMHTDLKTGVRRGRISETAHSNQVLA